MAINTDIKDAVVDHSAMVRLFEDQLHMGIDNIHDRYTNRMRASIIRGGSTASIERRVAREVNRFVDSSFKMTSSQLRGFISAEADFASDVLDMGVGEVWKVRGTPKTALRNIVTTQTIRDSRLLSQHFMDIGVGDRVRINGTIRRGIANGDNIDDIANRLFRSKTLNISRLQTRALVRTAITQYGSTASELVYQQNADVLKGYQYVATLDSRTSAICGRNDGRVFNIDDGNAPRPPLHWNCRSTTIPVVKGYNEINSDSDRVRKAQYDNLSGRKRAALNGVAPIAEDYSAWLGRQNYELQMRHLGTVDRVELFREGTLRLIQFTNVSGKYLDISTLRSLAQFQSQRLNRQLAARTIVCRSPCKDFTKSEDFEIASENNEVRSTRDFYDSPDSNEIHYSFIDHVTFQAKAGKRLRFADFKGDTHNARFASYQRQFTDPDNKFLNPITGEYVHESNVGIIFIDDELQAIRNRISNNKNLTQSDKDYLLGRFDTDTGQLLSGPAHGAVLQSAHDTFQIIRTNVSALDGKTFRQLFEAQLHKKNTGGVDRISRRLNQLNRRDITEGQRLRNTQITLAGRDSVDIEDLLRQEPMSSRRISEYKVPTEVIDDLRESIDGKGGPSNILMGIDNELLSEVVEDFLIRAPSNNFDSSAHNIGRTIWRRRGEDLFDGVIQNPGTSMEFWETGQIILQGLTDTKRINRRVYTTRVPRDLDEELGGLGTKRTYQQEYIQFVDEGFVRIMTDRDIIRKRVSLGFDQGERTFLPVRANDVFYRNLDGTNSRTPVHTSNLTRQQHTVSAGQAERLNNNANIEYSVDPNGYAGFLDKYINNTNKGTRNAAQQTILDRNADETLAAFRYQLRRSQEDTDSFFTVQGQLHESGRFQNIGLFTPHSGEFWRSVLVTRNARAIGPNGLNELIERIAVLVDKSANNNVALRRSWGVNNRDRLDELGALINQIARSPQANPKALIAKLDKNELWVSLNGKVNEQQLLGAYAQELNNIGTASARRGRGGGRFADTDKISSYESRLSVELDASESGQGIIATITKNKDAASKTNLVTQGSNQRLRTAVAEGVLRRPEIRADLGFITQSQAEKLLKDSITTSGYGSSPSARSRRLLNGTKANPGGLRQIVGDEDSIAYLNNATVADYRAKLTMAINQADIPQDEKRILRRIRRDLNNVDSNGVPTQDELLSIDRYLDPETREVVQFLTNNNGNIITSNHLKQFTRAAREILDEELPSLTTYFNFAGDAYESFLQRPGQSRLTGIIPTIDLDGNISNLTFLSKERLRFTRMDDRGRTILTSISSDTPSTQDIAKARSAGPVLNIFSQDSAIAGRAAANGRWNVYDGFGATLNELDDLRTQTRGVYAELADSNILKDQLNLLRQNGLPDDDFISNGMTFPGYFSLNERLEELLGDLTGDDILEGGRWFGVD